MKLRFLDPLDPQKEASLWPARFLEISEGVARFTFQIDIFHQQEKVPIPKCFPTPKPTPNPKLQPPQRSSP